ncbi:Gram-negative bacterial tonB protein [Tsuneonella dongtanensis]|uniref:Gram-negative bacterial tonB protein n=1 Tax=Tsuneonella dongtanensis TaxID=692370 RepID=A0A1B2AE58_9SPHN|nr:TonB family protein [Tsuneonella dongtanensis]ANY20433.1 Gram-negative bacterial tonB protein [Tsuneonella dongtanensis]
MLAIYLTALAAATAGAGEMQEGVEPRPAPPPIRVAPAPPPPKRPEGPNLPPTPRYGLSSTPMYGDIPRESRERERKGTTEVELAISKWGRVADCRVVESSGDADLDAAACTAFATRAQFWPATDASGQDTAGIWRQKMDWSSMAPPMVRAVPSPATFVPTGRSETFPRPPVQQKFGWARVLEADWPEGARDSKREGTTKVSFEVDPEGKPAACQVIDSSGHPDLDARSCVIVGERGMFKPALAADGTPTRGRVTQEVIWRVPTKSGASTARSSIPIRRSPITLPAMLLKPGRVAMTLETTEGGKVENCKVSGEGPAVSIANPIEKLCEDVKTRGIRAPLSDKTPLPETIEVEITIRTTPKGR